jgi:transglutaminase-like putative cysteine protease
MVMSLNLAVKDCTGLDIPLARVVLITLISIAAVSIIIKFPISIMAILIPGIGWSIYNYYANPSVIKLYVQEILEFSQWLYGYIAGYNYFEPGYSLVFAILYVALTALVISLIVYSNRGGFALIMLGTAAMTYFWFVYVEKARQYLVLYLLAAIMLYSYQVYKKRLKEWTAADSIIMNNVGRNWMFFSVIAIAISLSVSLALPLNLSPVRWTWLNDRVLSSFPFIAEWRNDALESFSYGYNSRYSLSSAGYTDKKLGGEIRLDNSVLMTVKAQGEDTIYLRGAVRDRYFKNSWSKSKRRLSEYNPGYSMTFPYGDNINTYERTFEITHKKLLTSTIFAPYSIYKVQHNSKKIFVDEDSEAYTSKMTMKEEPYIVKSIMPYMNVAGLKQSKTQEMEADDYRQYTALSGDISPRVRSLALEITKGQSNNYDKAKAVEKYLRQNYKYTLKPPKLDSHAEFTDHFLFEGKEGYCTYFATAMSVLLRSAGVPCRYVEGFAAEYEGAEERDVRGTNAHAWVEVYFDDYGWVTFEPTPQYPEFEIIEAWKEIEAVETDTAHDTVISDIDIADISGRRGQLEDGEMVGDGAIYGDQKSRFNIVNIILLIVFSILIIRFSFMSLLWIIKEIDLGRSRGRRFAMNYIKDMIWYLKHAGFTIKPEETLREFLKRVIHNNDENLSDISNITLILERIRYSNYELDEKEKRVLEVFRKEVKSFALKKKGALKLFISIFILGDRGSFNA